MLKIRTQKRFEKDYKTIKKRRLNTDDLWYVIKLLQNEIHLPRKYKDHPLVNDKNYLNTRECHIKPDWLLVYRINHKELELLLLRTGSHADLFE